MIAQRLGYEEGQFGEGSIVQALQLNWGGSAKRASQLADYYWRDAPFTLRVGPDGGADSEYQIVLSGMIADMTAQPARISLQMADQSVALARPIISAPPFTGAGGIEGVAELKGQLKWRAVGRCRNVGLRVLDPANNIWVATDPARPLQAIDQIYDRGNAASSVLQVAWAGSIVATLAALSAAICADGGGAAAPSIGCIKWWFANPGTLTCDLRGEIGAGYIDRPADIAAWAVAAAMGPPVNAISLAAARVLRNNEAGYLVKDDVSAGAAITALLGGVSLWWGMTQAGEMEFGEYAFGASAGALIGVKASRVQTHKPVKQITLGWRQNNTILSRSDIAGALLANTVLDVEANLATTYALALARGRLTVGGPFPDAATSIPGDVYQSDGGIIYDRINADGLTLNGDTLVIGGATLRLLWQPSAAQPLSANINAASLANVLATAAQESANSAIDSLSALDDDAVISVFEKKNSLIPQDRRLENAYAALTAAATSLVVPFVATAAARTAWQNLRNAISPAWNNDSVASPAPANWQVVLDGYDGALSDLNEIVHEKAATLAVWTGVGGAGRPEDNADVTSVITGQATISINANNAGVPQTTLPKTQAFMLMRGGVDVTNVATWSVAILSGTITASIAAGVLSLSLNAGVLTTSTLRLTAVYLGTTRIFDLRVTRIDAPAAPPSGGGSSNTGSISGALASSTPVPISPELTVTIGSGGNADLSALYTFETNETVGNATRSMVARWYRWNGSAYIAIGAAVAAYYDFVPVSRESGEGNITYSDAGLTAGSTQKYRLYGNAAGNSITTARNVTGSVSATGS